MLARATAALCLAGCAAGHGMLVLPPSRNVEDAEPAGASMWFSQGCSIGCPSCTEGNTEFVKSLCGSTMKPTINDPRYRTFNRANRKPTGLAPIFNGSAPTEDFPADWTATHPWRAPGSVPPLDPCGLAGGSTKNNDAAGGFGVNTGKGQGYPGSKLAPLAQKTKWAAGRAASVAWQIAANHGGGYQYRLCPASEPLTEGCFAGTPLAFVGAQSQLRYENGTQITIPATRVTEGVLPAGSTWSMNPVPACDINGVTGGFNATCDVPQFPPPPGCDATCWGYQPCFETPPPSCAPLGPGTGCCHQTSSMVVIDEVQVPKGLHGDYVLQWRWDSEHTPQIWSGCSDVTISRW